MIRNLIGYLLLLVCVPLIQAGCGTVTAGRATAVFDAEPKNVSFETLTSSVRLAYHTAEKNLAGRGMLVYQHPDKIRLVMLSPLGTTALEALIDGRQVTLLYPANGLAFSGPVYQLPHGAGARVWGLMQWVWDTKVPPGLPAETTIIRRDAQGGEETVIVKNGLLAEKRRVNGEQVQYREYHRIQGVWIATELHLVSADGERLKLILEDPEINLELLATTFTPRLAGLQLLPLSELKFR